MPILVIVFVLALTIVQLHLQGRSWWCACGSWRPWAGDIWSMHNSQHVADPYSLTHLLHGFVLCGLLAWGGVRLAWVWRFVLAILLEAAWEVLENTEFVIQRYREATQALGYTGDTIANSMGDVAFCGVGFLIARSLGPRWSFLLFVLTDCVLLLWIRDSLVLNVIMLIWPVDVIKQWQLGN